MFTFTENLTNMPQGYSLCQHCKRPNYNVDDCSHCGNYISLEPLKVEEKPTIEPKKETYSNKLEVLYKKYKSHPNFFVRVLTQVLYSITLAIVGFAAFIGSLIAALAG